MGGGDLTKYQTTLPPFTIAGRAMSVAEVIADLQSRLDASQGATAAKAAWLNAVKNDHDERLRTKRVLAGARECLLVAFGGQIDHLADLGLVARKTGALTPDQKVAAIAKGKATRVAPRASHDGQESKEGDHRRRRGDRRVQRSRLRRLHGVTAHRRIARSMPRRTTPRPKTRSPAQTPRRKTPRSTMRPTRTRKWTSASSSIRRPSRRSARSSP
jgi:hypothetical protein